MTKRRHYKCCQCANKYLENSLPKHYRTFADSFGSTIGDPHWRLCQQCVDENRKTRKVYAVVAICFIGWIIWSHM